MTTSQLSSLQSLLDKLEENKIILEKQGESFTSKSLFSAIHGLTDLRNPRSPDFQKIIEVSTELTRVIELIQFCQTILQKLKSNEPLAQNEETFLEYISMVSQILGMTSEHRTLQVLINSKCSNYIGIVQNLCSRLSERNEAFMNHMNYSSYLQRMVYSKNDHWKKPSGSPSKTHRRITEQDKIEIKEKKRLKQCGNNTFIR